MASPLAGGRRSRTLAALATVMMCIAAPFVTVGPASADVGFSVVPLFPPVLTVGQAGVPASISITNASNGLEAGGTVTINDITLVPSCGVFSFAPDCPGPSVDPDVFALSATGLGEAGTACAGQTFTITNIDQVQDKYSFTPVGPAVILQPPGTAGGLDVCRINFTLTVLKVPTKDAQPAPGIQTTRVAAAFGTSNVTGALGASAQSGVSTVNPGTPTIATLVSPPVVPPATTPTVNVGSSFTDTATVTGVTNGPTPTGTVTFGYVFDAPGVANCTGPLTPLAPPSPLVPSGGTPPTATATSPSVLANQAGTYHFVATYSGDANYLALAHHRLRCAGRERHRPGHGRPHHAGRLLQPRRPSGDGDHS